MNEKRSKIIGIGIFLMFVLLIVEILALFFGQYLIVFILAPTLTIALLIVLSIIFISKEWIWVGVDLFLDKRKELQQRFWKSGMTTFSTEKTKEKIPFGESEDGLDEIITDKTHHRISAGNRLSVLIQGIPESVDLLKTYNPTVDPEIFAQQIRKAYEKGRLRQSLQEEKILKKMNTLVLVLFVVAGIVVAGIVANYLLADNTTKVLLDAITSIKDVVGSQITEKIVEL